MKKIANRLALCTIIFGMVIPNTVQATTLMSDANGLTVANEQNKTLGSASELKSNSKTPPINSSTNAQTQDATSDSATTSTKTQSSETTEPSTTTGATATTTTTTTTSQTTQNTENTTTDSSADATDKGSKTTLSAAEMVPDPVFRGMITHALKKDPDYEFTEAELLSITDLDFHFGGQQTVSDWTGMERLTNLQDISDYERASLTPDSDFVGLAKKISQLPNLTEVSLSVTFYDYSALKELTSTSIETLNIPLSLDTGLTTADYSFLENVLANPSLKRLVFVCSGNDKVKYKTSYKNGVGSDIIQLPQLPTGYAMNISGLPQGWQLVNQRLIHDGDLATDKGITSTITISGPQADKIKFMSRFSPKNFFNAYFSIHLINQTAVNVHDSTIYVGDNWTPEDNFDGALDMNGKPVDFSQVTVNDSQANLTKPGTFKVTYTYDGVTSTATITVKENKTAVKVHDSAVYVGDSWKAEDNFDSATDKAGDAVDFSKVTVDDSQKDVSKAGKFKVTYTYDGVTSTATITVKENKTAVKVHDSAVYVGDSWKAEDNFDSATDKAGDAVDFSKVTVDDSQKDVSKAGKFKVTYTYDGVTSTATITVKENKTAVKVHDSAVYVGDNWKAEDNFDSATDKDGNAVDFSKVTVDDSQKDVSKVGSFNVTYTYDGVTSTTTVTVKENKTAVNVHDSTIYVGDNWKAEDNFDSAVDKDGNAVDFSKVTVDDSQKDVSKAGQFKVTYTYDSVTSTATVTVKENKTAVKVHDSAIYVGDNWKAEDNFDSATDKDGNAVDLSQVTVDDSQKDVSKIGSFKVAYTYDGVTSTATVTVKENKTAVKVYDSTIYVGDSWKAEANFDSATDKDGNAIDFSKVTVDDSQKDVSKVGSFKVTYTYDGVTSTATITVKENKTAVKVHDSEINVGDNWKAEDNFYNATDKKGDSVDLNQIMVDDSQVDTTKVGSFTVSYTYGNITSTATVKVVAKDESTPTPDDPSDDGKNDGDTTVPPKDEPDKNTSHNNNSGNKGNVKDTTNKPKPKKQKLPKTGETRGTFLNVTGYSILVLLGALVFLKNKSRK
ncbi:hypothetical protein IGI37_003471 [Enterococcus sp. AZ194]|uniref:bacterial Ig-like domain-containing protein n=1 Tax=Enterococcus sp. AZ194 TaxID=2774629 RepID=UPI003F23F668